MEINGTSNVDAVRRISSEAPDTEEEYSKEDQVVEEEVQQDTLTDDIGQRVDILA